MTRCNDDGERPLPKDTLGKRDVRDLLPAELGKEIEIRNRRAARSIQHIVDTLNRDTVKR